MVENTAMLGHLTQRDALSLLGEWIDVLGQARRRQANYTPSSRTALIERNRGWDTLVPALAGLPPALLAQAEAYLSASQGIARKIDGPSILTALRSLSQPPSTIEPTFGVEPSDEKTEARNGAKMAERELTWELVEELEQRVVAVEAQRDRYLRVVSMIGAMSAEALADVPDGGEQDASVAGGDAAVGF